MIATGEEEPPQPKLANARVAAQTTPAALLLPKQYGAPVASNKGLSTVDAVPLPPPPPVDEDEKLARINARLASRLPAAGPIVPAPVSQPKR